MTDIPTCIHCGCSHPWLLNMSSMAIRLKWKCNECGTEQMTHFSEQEEDD